MMFLLSILLFLSFEAWAIDPSACNPTSTAFGMGKCLNEVRGSLKNFGGPPKCDCVSTMAPPPPPPPRPSSRPLPAAFFTSGSADCGNFISGNRNGGYGPWGLEIINYLNEQPANSTFFRSDLAGMNTGVAACPGWNKMSLDEKKHFWVWVMASISKIESTCNPRARNGAGTNGVAVGLTQLDERASGRSWRGPNCRVQNVTPARENLRCGMDILEELLKGRSGDYKGNGELWGPRTNSYWQHLRQRDGGGISDLILLNPFCKK